MLHPATASVLRLPANLLAAYKHLNTTRSKAHIIFVGVHTGLAVDHTGLHNARSDRKLNSISGEIERERERESCRHDAMTSSLHLHFGHTRSSAVPINLQPCYTWMMLSGH